MVSCAGSEPKNTEPQNIPAQETTVSGDIPSGKEQEQPEPAVRQDANIIVPNLVFIPAGMVLSPVPAGTGNLTRDQRDQAVALSGAQRSGLSAAFRFAYVEGIFRGVPLNGVLGGDLVHSWPSSGPTAWVQNWRSAENRPNSWGLPSLILAIRALSQNRVFIVHGGIMDEYGKSAGINGANGAAGYGFPRGHEFFHNGGAAQRFDFGLITVDENGKGAFFPEEAPSSLEDPPLAVGAFPGTGLHQDEQVPDIFRSAWNIAGDRNLPAMVPDGPVIYLDFSDSPWLITDGPETQPEQAVSIGGIYYQSFDEGKSLLILGIAPADRPALPPYARYLASSFLELLLSPPEIRPAGAESLTRDTLNAAGGDAFSRTLLRGLSLYGFPLTDPLPMKTGTGAAPYREAQRFSKGWIATN
jgi:hypothetical protein